MTDRGKLIVFEGTDGTGKTTLVEGLVKAVTDQGINCIHTNFPGRDTQTIGQLVYDVHHEPETIGIKPPTPTSLQALHVAAHLHLIETLILPALAEGTWIIQDRYWWSTKVYGSVQGANMAVLDQIIASEKTAWGNTVPAALFILSRSEPLRDERDLDAWRQIRNGYLAIIAQEQNVYPVHRIDDSPSVEHSLSEVLKVIKTL